MRETLPKLKEKIIDAEYFDPKNPKPPKKAKLGMNGYSLNRDDDMNSPEKESSGGSLFSSIGNNISRFLGIDDDSKRKRERKNELNRSIDQMFKGSGFAGGLMGSLFKGVAGMAMEAMQESMETIGVVQDQAKISVELNGALGVGVAVGMPFQQSSSSMNVNGVTVRKTFMAMPVSGSRGTGQLECDATVTGEKNAEVTFNSLTLLTQDGQRINLKSVGRGPGGGQVIDV